MPVSLADVVTDFSLSLAQVDSSKPVWAPYQPGIGPHPESEAVKLITAEMSASKPGRYSVIRLNVPYPGGGRQRCDVVIGNPPEWALEIKLLRLLGDNGKPNDNMLMHLLSPYPAHRSALTDAAKLRASSFTCDLGILVYGFEYEDWPMAPALDALDVLIRQRTQALGRAVARFEGLVHPVHKSGRVYAWEINRE